MRRVGRAGRSFHSGVIVGGDQAWQTLLVTTVDDAARRALVRRGFALEWATLGWNVAGIIILAIAAVAARSVALAGFGLDSLIEIGASAVVIWELSGTGAQRQRRGLHLIGYAFAALAVYLLIQMRTVCPLAPSRRRAGTPERRAPPVSWRRHHGRSGQISMPNDRGTHSPTCGVKAASRVAVMSPAVSSGSSRPAATSSAAACMRL
jgi:hypothetical protein